MRTQRHLHCSFCRKDESQVAKLVAGPRVYICDACVAVASRLMDDDSPGGGFAPAAETSLWAKLVARGRRLVHRGDARRARWSPQS
jgi:ATP-dependent Clp protease ATP-binding subunit ClpX